MNNLNKKVRENELFMQIELLSGFKRLKVCNSFTLLRFSVYLCSSSINSFTLNYRHTSDTSFDKKNLKK